MDRPSRITPCDLEFILCDEMAEPKALPLSLLEEITNGFCDDLRIGRGGFAVVYKGKLESRTVAVKRLSNTYMYEKEFQREVECLMMVKHKNVVRFLGYCADTQGTMERHEGKFIMADVQQRLLCFEYLPKGSLHGYITDRTRELRWRDRYQIITGICQGLHYLHQKNILHLDLKPANILLDDSWVPKITDFGVSRCFDRMQSQIITNLAGTPGYCAPEYFNHTEVTYRDSYRLDIYSLGVVIIEILTGKKGYHDVDRVVETWSDMLEESQWGIQMEQVRLCAEIGIECANFDPMKRPNTRNIISRFRETERLYGYIETGASTSQQTNPEMLNETMHALWMSYQQLNPNIRQCIEYCSIFPKGTKLKIVELVRMWIAQGFVETDCATEDMEAIAEGYIQELVSCSFLQQVGTSSDIDFITISDEMHDLLDKVAVKCFRIENTTSHTGEGWEGDIPRDIEHIFVQIYDGELITEKILGLKKIRTLIVYVVEKDTSLEEKVMKSIFKKLTELRVLAIAFSREHLPINIPNICFIPESIYRLKHLRYLSFRTRDSCKINLPRTLNKLEHIQVLDFGSGSVSKVAIDDLINLRHIIIADMNFPNMGKLIKLQTMENFTVRNGEGYELKQLRGLNKLRGSLFIESLGYVQSKEEALEANVAAKEGLTDLELSWNGSAHVRPSQEIEAEILEGLCPPVGLQTLQISYYVGSRYPDWMAGNHNAGPNYLQGLGLRACRQLVSASPLAEAFPHLRVLQLSYCHWEALPGNMEHLKSLEELRIEACMRIQSLPTLPRSLDKLALIHCDEEFTKSCQTVGHSNWKKIEHIPETEIIRWSFE